MAQTPADARQMRRLNLAIRAIGDVLDATVLGLILVDEKGVALHLKPGVERHVTAMLASVDFRQLKRVVEEHAE